MICVRSSRIFHLFAAALTVTRHIKHEIWPGQPTRPVSVWIMIRNFPPDWYFNSMSAKFCIHWVKETWGNSGRFDILIGWNRIKGNTETWLDSEWSKTEAQNQCCSILLFSNITLQSIPHLHQLTYCQKRNLNWTTVVVCEEMIPQLLVNMENIR